MSNLGEINADQIVGGENARGYKYEGSKGSEAELEHIYEKLYELEKAIHGHAAELQGAGRHDQFRQVCFNMSLMRAHRKSNGRLVKKRILVQTVEEDG